MFEKQTIQYIQNSIWDLMQFHYEGTIRIEKYDGIRVTYENGVAVIGCSTKPQLARGFYLLAKELRSGAKIVSISQKPHFRELTLMLCQRTPMTVDSVVRYLTHMAALGYTGMFLYMETTYSVDGYPFFGHLKGRYNLEELKAIDDAADALGIEVIPCVQTLAHLEDYLRWPAATPVKDNGEVLLIGEPETYRFIEAMVQTLRNAFRSKRIHIGFDEARGMGLGKYLSLHGYTDRLELFNFHLTKVKEICAHYDFHPMMWSDMPFRLGGDGYSGEYDLASSIPVSTQKAMEGVDLCYWDYYAYEYEVYDAVLKKHLSFPNCNVVFSGGIWVDDMHLIHMEHTLRSTIPALHACLDNGIDSVMATTWGRADCTNVDQSIYGLSVFSEFCYLGKSCTTDDIYAATTALTGVSRAFLEAISDFHLGHKNSLKVSARILSCDMLYPLLRHEPDFDYVRKRLSNGLSKLENEAVPEASEDLRNFAVNLFDAVIRKSHILENLRNKYLVRDMAFLEQVSEVWIPQLIPLYKKISHLKQKLWLNSTKPFGIETVQMDFAGMIVRMEYTQKRLRQFQHGEISIIEELEEVPLQEGYVDWLSNHSHMAVNPW